MANEIKVFENTEFGKVRILYVNGKIYFVGKEVAQALGYSNERKAIKDHVDEEDKLTERIVTSGQNRNITIINESGLYSLILASKLPKAKQFKKWVTSEVLPQLRESGTYSLSNKPDSYMIDNPIERAKRWIEEQQEKLALVEKIEEQKPKVEFAEQVNESKNLIDVNAFSKLIRNKGLEIGRNRLFSLLREMKFLRWNNEPYQRFIDGGYFETKEYTYTTYDGTIKTNIKTLITGKGQQYIFNAIQKKMKSYN